MEVWYEALEAPEVKAPTRKGRPHLGTGKNANQKFQNSSISSGVKSQTTL
jgi:hypothetical protein